MERAIARITVGAGQAVLSQGTGFLVSRERLVLTALHVVADLTQSRRDRRLVPLAGAALVAHEVDGRRVGTRTNPPIKLFFGRKAGVWQPAGPVWIVDGLYDLADDWAVLGFDGAIEPGVEPLELAALARGLDDEGWRTMGFPAAARDGGFYEGTFTHWDERELQLTALAAKDLELDGLSGAPCVAKGQAVGVIYEARLRDKTSVGGAITALGAGVIARAAGGRLPCALDVPVPFETVVTTELHDLPDTALERGGELLALPPPRRHLPQLVRSLIATGLGRAADVLATMGARERGLAVLPALAAAKLHHEAVALLASALATGRTGALQAGDERICAWYTDRASYALGRAPWGARLLHLSVAGQLEEVKPEPGEDPVDAVVRHLVALLPAAARALVDAQPTVKAQADVREFWRLALKGKADFSVALHGEKRVEVAEALRARLPRVHVLMVREVPPELDEAARARVVTVAPHLEDEDALLGDYYAARVALQ